MTQAYGGFPAEAPHVDCAIVAHALAAFEMHGKSSRELLHKIWAHGETSDGSTRRESNESVRLMVLNALYALDAVEGNESVLAETDALYLKKLDFPIDHLGRFTH